VRMLCWMDGLKTWPEDRLHKIFENVTMSSYMARLCSPDASGPGGCKLNAASKRDEAMKMVVAVCTRARGMARNTARASLHKLFHPGHAAHFPLISAPGIAIGREHAKGGDHMIPLPVIMSRKHRPR